MLPTPDQSNRASIVFSCFPIRLKVLCSVADVGAVLRETARVLKPGGRLLFVEHTVAQVGSTAHWLCGCHGHLLGLATDKLCRCPPPCLQGQPLLWLAQHALNPLQQLLADNCHLTRDPISMIETVFGAGNVQAQRFSVDGASLIAPHVAGLARRT